MSGICNRMSSFLYWHSLIYPAQLSWIREKVFPEYNGTLAPLGLREKLIESKYPRDHRWLLILCYQLQSLPKKLGPASWRVPEGALRKGNLP